MGTGRGPDGGGAARPRGPGAGSACPVPRIRRPFDPYRRRSSVEDVDGVHVTGAPDAVLPDCAHQEAAEDALAEMTGRGLRVLAVARAEPADETGSAPDGALQLLGLVGLEDPPRPDVGAAIVACRRAGIRLAMVTGDHPGTARSIAAEVGLLGADGTVLQGKDFPDSDDELARLLNRDGIVVARVTPEQKLRIAKVLQQAGHVVAMTGDGVNDGPALRTADIGVAMGASGTDVAREAADLVLLDDHFGTIVSAVELGRATFANIRRFLTYHLTDNVAELTPFAFWALSGGSIPLGIAVLQVLALDIGTDLLPALALGAEAPNPRTMTGPARTGKLIDSIVVRRRRARPRRGVHGDAGVSPGPDRRRVAMGRDAGQRVAGGRLRHRVRRDRTRSAGQRLRLPERVALGRPRRVRRKPVAAVCHRVRAGDADGVSDGTAASGAARWRRSQRDGMGARRIGDPCGLAGGRSRQGRAGMATQPSNECVTVHDALEATKHRGGHANDASTSDNRLRASAAIGPRPW